MVPSLSHIGLRSWLHRGSGHSKRSRFSGGSVVSLVVGVVRDFVGFGGVVVFDAALHSRNEQSQDTSDILF